MFTKSRKLLTVVVAAAALSIGSAGATSSAFAFDNHDLLGHIDVHGLSHGHFNDHDQGHGPFSSGHGHFSDSGHGHGHFDH